jgi:hypothetical protein
VWSTAVFERTFQDFGLPEATRYTPSTRLYRGLDELDYPFHDWTAVVLHEADHPCLRNEVLPMSPE